LLKTAFLRVRPDKVDRLKSWLAELNLRHDEVLETFAQETVRHEVAYLLEGRDGPILVYVMEAQDFDQARRAYQGSNLPIDAEHRRVMMEISEGPAAVETLYECRMKGE
jgi:uncharacterized protein DUF6176